MGGMTPCTPDADKNGNGETKIKNITTPQTHSRRPVTACVSTVFPEGKNRVPSVGRVCKWTGEGEECHSPKDARKWCKTDLKGEDSSVSLDNRRWIRACEGKTGESHDTAAQSCYSSGVYLNC